jgi:hypothetical protein
MTTATKGRNGPKKSAPRKEPRRARAPGNEPASASRPPAARTAGSKRPRPKPRAAPPPPDVGVDPDVLEFIAAVERYRKQHGRLFPTWSEVLHVVKSLGYRKPEA